MTIEDKELITWAENYTCEPNELRIDQANHIVDLKKYLTTYATRMKINDGKDWFGLYRSKLIQVKKILTGQL